MKDRIKLIVAVLVVIYVLWFEFSIRFLKAGK